jgi:heme exporter protein CcmD
MDWNAAHSGFVIASYAISVTVLSALIYVILRRDRRLQAAVKAKNDTQ